MFSPPRKMIFLALVFSALFIVGMVQLFLLRFEAGDVYPAYSSLRSDPLGAQALFQSLQRISGDSVRRNFRPLDQAYLDGNTTLMILGMNARSFFRGGAQYEKLMENLAQSGGRLVLSFTPSSKMERIAKKMEDAVEQDTSEVEDDDSKDENEKASEDDKTAVEPGECKETDGSPKAGGHSLGFWFNEPTGDEWEDFADRFYGAVDILPASIPWRAPLSFQLKDNSWETLYTWQGEPVVVQRPWGDGKVVMLADSYLLSNEALRNHRYPGLLTWLVQPGNTFIFDESLKGLVEQPGMAGLARQYRLHGVFGALLVVVVLFIWRQSAIFITPVREERTAPYTQPAAGRDTSQGLVHLARQHIDTKTLLTICFQAWKTQAARHVPSSRTDELEAMVVNAAADPGKETQVKTYIEICELLKQGKRS